MPTDLSPKASHMEAYVRQRLEELHELRQAGGASAAEYSAKRREILEDGLQALESW